MKIFDRLLGRKKSSCKDWIELIEARIHFKRKRKQAVVNFLRKDVADLITYGRDDIAFRRIDALIFETNQISCYDMIEHCCQCIMSQLPCLQKQRVCPQEETEAVATIIYAAAQFPELPELCDLRGVFMTRCGSAMESPVNPEFAEKASTKSFSKDRKLKLMQEIAQEFYVDWDSKFFSQKPNPSVQEPPKKEVHIWNDKEAALYAAPPNGIRKKQDSVLTIYTEPPLTGNVLKDARSDVKDIHMIPSRNRIFPVDPIKMDKLLMHYSRKGMPGQTTKAPPHVDHKFEKKHQTSGNRTHPERAVESWNPPTRAVSLPAEQISPTKRAAPPRTATMQPDIMISARGAGRVHPKLPDYDELAAHFTALKTAAPPRAATMQSDVSISSARGTLLRTGKETENTIFGLLHREGIL